MQVSSGGTCGGIGTGLDDLVIMVVVVCGG